ncbi:hypothetical protein KSNIM_38495, partial [Kitasatospora sp. DSM 101779]|nr:hypothetical protein [Kitasatospora sp. DSM 101779]
MRSGKCARAGGWAGGPAQVRDGGKRSADRGGASGGRVGLEGVDRVDALAVVGEEVDLEELPVTEEVEGGVVAGLDVVGGLAQAPGEGVQVESGRGGGAGNRRRKNDMAAGPFAAGAGRAAAPRTGAPRRPAVWAGAAGARAGAQRQDPEGGSARGDQHEDDEDGDGEEHGGGAAG